MCPTPTTPSLEAALLQALAEERRLAEERALIPGLVQHDLANLLCQVSLSTALVANPTSAAEHERGVRDIRGAVKRMGELLDGMRFLFHARGGVTDYAPRDLAAFVRELVEEPGVWPAGPPIALELPRSMWCTFSPTLVRPALVNLIGNAVAYATGTWVRVRLAPVRGGCWQLAVANGGPGIPVDHLPYLGALGRKVDQAGRSGCPGLGLYIARLCIRYHGAVLRVHSKPRLTVFSFALHGAQRAVTSHAA